MLTVNDQQINQRLILRFLVVQFNRLSRKMLSTGPRYHFKSIMCVWSLSPLLLLKKHYWGCRINSLNPPLLSFIHSLSEGQTTAVCILTQISTLSGWQRSPHTALLLQGLISRSCHVQNVTRAPAFWRLLWSIVVFNEWLMTSNSFNSFSLAANALRSSGGDNMLTRTEHDDICMIHDMEAFDECVFIQWPHLHVSAADWSLVVSATSDHLAVNEFQPFNSWIEVVTIWRVQIEDFFFIAPLKTFP